MSSYIWKLPQRVVISTSEEGTSLRIWMQSRKVPLLLALGGWWGTWTLPVELDTFLKVGRWEQHFLSPCPEDGMGLAMASTGPGKAMPSERASVAGLGSARWCGGQKAQGMKTLSPACPRVLTYVTEALKLRLVVLRAIIFIF